MKKIIFISLTLLFIGKVNSQVIQQRLLKVDPSDVAKFEAGVAKKTKMYNSRDGQTRFSTWKILTGQNANHYIRMMHGNSMDDFDNVDKVGNTFWQKTVGSLHESVGNRIMTRNDESSFVPENKERNNHRRVIYYNYKDSGSKDFWMFRNRSKKVWEQTSYNQRVTVMECNSGCNGNWVMVRFHHKNFAGESDDWDSRPDFVKSYNKLFGEGSLEQDSERFRASLMPEGMRVRHQQYMPELSSPWN
jgi:hypothetical protein